MHFRGKKLKHHPWAIPVHKNQFAYRYLIYPLRRRTKEKIPSLANWCEKESSANLTKGLKTLKIHPSKFKFGSSKILIQNCQFVGLW